MLNWKGVWRSSEDVNDYAYLVELTLHRQADRWTDNGLHNAVCPQAGRDIRNLVKTEICQDVTNWF